MLLQGPVAAITLILAALMSASPPTLMAASTMPVHGTTAEACAASEHHPLQMNAAAVASQEQQLLADHAGLTCCARCTHAARHSSLLQCALHCTYINTQQWRQECTRCFLHCCSCWRLLCSPGAAVLTASHVGKAALSCEKARWLVMSVVF